MRIMRRRDDDRAAAHDGFEHRASKRRAFFGIRRGIELVDKHEASLGDALEDLFEPQHVPRKAREVLLDRLWIA